MKTENSSFRFPDTSSVKLPHTCQDGFVVTQKEQLEYHLLIDQIWADGDIYSIRVKPIANALDKKEKIQWSLVFLEHALFHKKPEFGLGLGYQMMRGASFVFPFLEDSDEAFFIEFLKKVNNSEEPLFFIDEDIFFEAVERFSDNNELSAALKKEMSRRFEHLKEANKITSDFKFIQNREYLLVAKLLGEYDPTSFFKTSIDPEFATGEIDRFLTGGFPLAANDPYYDQHLVLDQLMAVQYENNNLSEANYRKIPTLSTIQEMPRKDQEKVFMATLYRFAWAVFSGKIFPKCQDLMNTISRKKMNLSDRELKLVIDAYLHPDLFRIGRFSILTFFKNVERQAKDHNDSELLKGMLEELVNKEERKDYDDRDLRKLKTKAKEILLAHFSDATTVEILLLEESDDFGKMVNPDLAQLDIADQGRWANLLRLAATASAGKPNAKFLAKAEKLITTLGEEKFVAKMSDWLTFLAEMEFTKVNDWYGYYISSNNVAVAKGLVWCLSVLDFESLNDKIEKLIIRCFKKIPGVGPASGALGNACIYAVASKKKLSGVALLNRVRSKIAQRNTKKIIGNYIEGIAKALNISVSDLEDFSIEDFGMNNGEKTIAFKDYTARLTMPAFGKTKLEWIKPDGKIQKSIPAFVRHDFAEELKALRAEIKLIPKTLTIQRDRLDRSYIQKRVFPYPHFRKYYFEHGLMSFLTHKLIWIFEKENQQVNAIWHKDQWQDVNGVEVDWIDESTSVRLWHALHSPTEEVLQWREFLQANEIKQPLKQAYREIYLLTEAEINTKTYSNRMAAHILKQHQFNALAGLRGWKYQLLGCYDDGKDGEVCSIFLPDHNLSVEYWINELNAEDAYNDTGIWNYVATDQVRYLSGGEVLDLIDVPKIIFSETMRDVDLFVGVASVGNDPAWQDSGGLPQFNNYWESYSFGDLTELAKTRKVVLEKLLPRLKIAKVAAIKGKFLVVKGKKRTYKIHIGSTNILMEPNDEYLCIVPARSDGNAKENLFIPFEGDRGFSILLSKAFLLAEDDKITDSTILSQIGN